MRLELFDYELPEELIAATPAKRRDESRLLVLGRRSGTVGHGRFHDMPGLLREGDLLVMNDARVIPARLHAVRETGGAVELLLVRRQGDDARGWLAMVRCGGSLREGERLSLRSMDGRVTLDRAQGNGRWTVLLGESEQEAEAMVQAGAMPLPPYILKSRRRRGLPVEMPELDRVRYQTVFADEPGAVAAPTAGLHFTEALLEQIREKGVETRFLTLMVGPGTFRPVKTENVEEHELDAEFYRLPADTARAVESALRGGRRIVATGTTTCRVLEHVARTGCWEEQSGWADLFIYPPFTFKAVGALLTNFHLPRSTLLMLVSAFAGRENVLEAYRQAVAERYRFYSYGDAMLIQ